MAAFIAGCGSPKHRAPVEQREGVPTARSEAPKPPPPGIENAGKPGYYSVKPGDTLIRIGLDVGQSWRDIARWNELPNPDSIEVGQVLRVVPPGADPTLAATRPAPSSRVEVRPLDAKGAPPAAGATTAGTASAAPSAAVASAPVAAAPAATAATTTTTTTTARESDEGIVWAWPAGGSVLQGFDEARNKGLALGGKSGDPVLAAADGRVVYAGSGLRGYGNLVIVKHNANYLTAYAHNQTLLVKEDQNVRRGQKIAEMGSSDAERVQLHFEIRRQGKPVDPAKFLPPR